LRQTEAAEEHERLVHELQSKMAQHQSSQSPWLLQLETHRAAIQDNKQRLKDLRERLRVSDVDVVLWGRVDELLGKRGLQNFVYEVALLELQRRAAKYLEILSEDSLRLELALDTQVCV
jgi:DNA repair exonuclease SbcCD ATPase subunit